MPRPVAASMSTDRREFLALAAASLLGWPAGGAFAQAAMPTRRIPSSGEALPIVGVRVEQGSSRRSRRTARNRCGECCARSPPAAAWWSDTWPRNPANDSRFGQVIDEPDLRGRLFVDHRDRSPRQGRRHRAVPRGAARLRPHDHRPRPDLQPHRRSRRTGRACGPAKVAGEARYIGVTVSEPRLHDALEAFLRRERPDVTHVELLDQRARCRDQVAAAGRRPRRRPCSSADRS